MASAIPHASGLPHSPPVKGPWISLPLGVVTLAERHGGIHVCGKTFESMVQETGELLAPFAAEARAANAEPGAQVEKVDFIEGEHVSRNEIHELNTAVKAMHTSIDYLYRRLNKR